MKKIANYGLRALLIAGTMIPAAQAWYGRVLPVAYNQQTGKWSILLGLNTNNGYWNDFGEQGSKGVKGNEVAQEALKNQTNSIYNIKISGDMPWYKFNDDIVHFVPVQYITDLSGAIGPKEDLFWVSEDVLLGQGDVYLQAKTRRGVNVSVSRGLLAYFRKNWPHARSRLSTTTQSKGAQTSTQSGRWSPAKNPGAIYFYQSGQPYYEFTNFQAGYPIAIGSRLWPTTEHYYQAMKFHDWQLQEQIRGASSAREAFNIARNNANKVRQNWHQISLETMLSAVRAKFAQHATLKDMLVKTGNKILIENAGQNDNFFGAGADYNGQNYLGRILMHVRAELSGVIPSGTSWVQSSFSK